MADFRERARIPFGYRIVDGNAAINPEEAAILKNYYGLYLSGLSMAEAAKEAGLDCSASTYRNILERKEYAGTDYYPAIITAEIQEKLSAERERRKCSRIRRKMAPPKAVRIYTSFYMEKGLIPADPSTAYQMIRPKKQ